MTNEEKTLNKAVDFMQECEQYLHSWCCTRMGKYQPIDTQGVRKILMDMVINGSKNPIKEFREGVENGTIILSTFTFGLSVIISSPSSYSTLAIPLVSYNPGSISLFIFLSKQKYFLFLQKSRKLIT